MITKSLEKDILNLDPDDKIQLIQLIFDSLNQISPEIEKAWAEESEKRIDAFESGKLKASDWDNFRDGIKHITINPQNLIYGDVEGNIGHQHGGKLPMRKYGDGATVTPGTDEKFNWSGLVPFEKMFY